MGSIFWMLSALAQTIAPASAAEGQPSPVVREPELRKELLEMEKVDQAARGEWLQMLARHGISVAPGKRIEDPKAMKVFQEETEKLAKVDHRNRARLVRIIERHGWPGATLVGKDGAQAAWLIVQHADHDRDFQRSCLGLMEKARAGEVEGKHIAYLTDRILVGEGKPQKFGTQLRGDFKPHPIENEATVDARRKALGMPSMAEYVKRARAGYEQLSAPAAKKK
jgi:hypothetical protein